jgi:ADP-heptose:LPS heptosyltransferase
LALVKIWEADLMEHFLSKYISTGGLGDSWIVYLKLLQMKDADLSWHHVESNNIVPPICRDLYKHFPATFEYDYNYIQNYAAGKWREYQPISSGVDSWCPLKGETGIRLEKPFLDVAPLKQKEYNAVIQVSGGAKNGRSWKFDPIQLKSTLKALGLNVALVGTDKRYEKKSDNSNFVGKLSLAETLDLIRKSDVFVGLSGFLNYYACSVRTKNLHLIESEGHEKRYYHPDWSEYTKGIEFGSMAEIIKELK